MLLVVVFWCQYMSTIADLFNYYGNNLNTYYPGHIVLNTIGYYEQRFSSTPAMIEKVDHLPGLLHPTMKKALKMLRFNETKNFERYVKTYFEPHNGIQAEIMRYKFSSLESNMESVENRSSNLIKTMKKMAKTGGSELEDFWFLQYQKRSVQKMIRAYNSSNLLPFSKILIPGVKLPWNTSEWIKKFDEIFEELKNGEPLVEAELFGKQKLWWIQNRKQICLFKIDQLRTYIKSVDNFFYQNRGVLSVYRWIKDREQLYSRKLSDLFWWLCRRDQYYREEYARLDYEKVWTPWLTTSVAPHLTTFDYFRYNGDFNHLLRRRNNFYAKFFKRKKINQFIRRLQGLPSHSSTVHIYGYLFDQYKKLTGYQPEGDNRELLVPTLNTTLSKDLATQSKAIKAAQKSLKAFCFQYFGKVRFVGLRSTIYKRIITRHQDNIRGYITYTHRGTLFGKICGDTEAVEDMKNFLKKLKTPSSKVTKLEFRGEGPIYRYPKGLKTFHFYKGLSENVGKTKQIRALVRRYYAMQTEGKYLETIRIQNEEMLESQTPVDREEEQVKRLFDKLAGNGDMVAMRKYNLKQEGIYDM